MTSILSDIENVLSTRHLVTTGLVVGAMLTVDPALSWLESEVGLSKVQDNKWYKAGVSAIAVLAAQLVADKLLQ